MSKPDGGPATGSADAYYLGRSDDGRHVLFSTARPIVAGVPDDLRPKLYDATRQRREARQRRRERRRGLRRAARQPHRQRRPRPADRTAISTDGSHIVFASPTQVYVRIDGNTTILVSASQKAGSVGDPAPTSATFMGAARDGSRIVFSSPDQLTDNAPSGGGIYAFDVASRTLTLIAAVGDPARRQDRPRRRARVLPGERPAHPGQGQRQREQPLRRRRRQRRALRRHGRQRRRVCRCTTTASR